MAIRKLKLKFVDQSKDVLREFREVCTNIFYVFDCKSKRKLIRYGIIMVNEIII